MPYNKDAYYLTWGGTLGVNEIWQCGVKFAPTDQSDIFSGAFDNIDINDIKAALTTWFNSGAAGAQVGSLAHFGWVKLAVLDVDGEYKFEPKLAPVVPAITPSAPSNGPPQTAYVVTLQSGETLGHANYGRFYVPVPSMTVGATADGLMTQTQANAARDAAKTMINSVNGEIDTVGINTRPAIYSKIGAGTTKVVSRISVGRALDTQRRRRNHLVESPNYVAL